MDHAPPPTRPAWALVSAAVATLAVAAVLLILLTARHRSAPPATGAILEPLPAPSPGDPAALRATLRGLAPADAPRAARLLANLHAALRRLPREQASALIRDFLQTKADAPTGGDFKVGRDGFLTGVPTLRVFLLDQLSQIDPAGAAAFARTILASMDSAEEWAVALREVARSGADPETRAFIAGRLREMFSNETWLRQAPVGFLEAFDVAVHLGGTDLIPSLTALVRQQDNAPVAHAAYLALDRLTLGDPVATLGALQDNPGTMKGRELTRANFFARADIREEPQRKLIEDYLLQPAMAADELEKFTALYPNANYMISNNLLTRTPTPDQAWIAARDRAALDQVERWLMDPRFARLRPQLQEIQRRLHSFVRSGASPR